MDGLRHGNLISAAKIVLTSTYFLFRLRAGSVVVLGTYDRNGNMSHCVCMERGELGWMGVRCSNPKWLGCLC
jgi:hypothetical protein